MIELQRSVCRLGLVVLQHLEGRRLSEPDVE